jgi:hypothetical protein
VAVRIPLFSSSLKLSPPTVIVPSCSLVSWTKPMAPRGHPGTPGNSLGVGLEAAMAKTAAKSSA